MKRAVLILIIAVVGAYAPAVEACVGKLLHVGVVSSPEGQVLAEMISTIVNERTGTTVSVRLYKTEQELYEAIKSKQVDIFIENTTRAMQVLNKPAEGDARKAYEVVKAAYEKELGLVWLKPFGFLDAGGTASRSYTATILRMDVVTNFPALPRVIDKLGSVLTDETHDRLVRSVESGEPPKKVARDFLKSKKLI